MNQPTINTRPLKKVFNQESTLSEIVDYIFNEELETENVLVNVDINGEVHPFHEDMKLLTEKLSEIGTINFHTQTSVELALEALTSCNEYIDIIVNKTGQLSESYRKNERAKANEQFIELIDILDLFLQLFAKILNTMKRNFPNSSYNTQEIQKLEVHLLSILKALIPAKENNDIIMLCDLLEYELTDNMTQWKINIVPHLKKIPSA